MKTSQWFIVAVVIACITGISFYSKFIRAQPSVEKQLPAAMQQSASATQMAAADSTSPQAEKEPIQNITDFDHFNSVVEGTPGKLLVFDLYADWCRPCRMLAPTFLSLARTHGATVNFYRVDIQKHQDIAMALQVNGIPHVVFIKDKEVVRTVVGLNPAETYEKILTACDSTVSAAECMKHIAAEEL
jgi:thioredoxin 1